jgi:hypothetical protein
MSCNGILKENETIPAISNFKNAQRNITPKKKVSSVMMKQSILNPILRLIETPEEVYSKRNLKLYDTISKDINPKTNFSRTKIMMQRGNASDLTDNKNLAISLQNEELHSSTQAEFMKKLITSTNKRFYAWSSAYNQNNDSIPILESKQVIETSSGRFSTLTKANRLYRVTTNRDTNLKVN